MARSSAGETVMTRAAASCASAIRRTESAARAATATTTESTKFGVSEIHIQPWPAASKPAGHAVFSQKRMSDLSKICLLTCAVTFVLVTLSSGAQNSAKPATATTDSAANTDVCKLLTNAEIEAVQREHVEQTRPNARSSGGLLIADCLFRTTTPSKSVSVELVMRDPKANSALTPQEFWRKQFG